MGNINKYSAGVVAFFVLFAAFLLTMERGIGIYDEGLILTGALRVYYGDYPHSDFYANYGPAQFYVISWLYELFGPNLLLERIFDLATRSLIVILSYYTVAKNFSRVAAAVSAFIVAAYLVGISFYGYPIYQTYLFSLAGLALLASNGIKDESRSYTFYAGLLLGIAALFRYDVGFFAYVALAFSIYIAFSIEQKKIFSINRPAYSALLKLSIGAAIPVSLILLSHLMHGALDDFIHDVIVFPKEHYAATRGLPFPSLLSLISKSGLTNISIYLPLVATGFSLYFVTSHVVFSKSLKNQLSLSKVFLIVSLSILVLMFFLKGVVRVSVLHMLLAILPASLLVVLMVEVVADKARLSRIFIAGVAFLFMISSLALVYGKLRGSIVLKDPGNFPRLAVLVANIPSAEKYEDHYKANGVGDYFIVGKERQEALDYLRGKVQPGDYFYSGLRRHDKVFVNDIAVYSLLNLRPATKWHHFDPALQNNPEIQKQIIADLGKYRPAYIMLDASWEAVNEPNDSSKSSGAFELDEFLASRYAVEKCFGTICVASLNQSLN